jgi:hypothetical protein
MSGLWRVTTSAWCILMACGDADKAVPDAPPDDGLPEYLVVVNVSGGPGGVALTPSSPTPGARCEPGLCRVPLGGSVVVMATTLTDWFFDGWNGSVTRPDATITLSNITAHAAVTANYINMRMDPCRDAPPANGHTTSMPRVPASYTSAAGWSTPARCPWSCNVEFCASGDACITAFVDRLAFIDENLGIDFFGSNREGDGRSIGAGEGVTPDVAITMNRFGFRFRGGFRDAFGNFGTQPNILQLDRRDGSGNLLASYTTTLPPNFVGEWVYWETPDTRLEAGTLTIFTSFLTTAFSQKVGTGVIYGGGYTGGIAYQAMIDSSGDLSRWPWPDHDPFDFQFRVQQRDPSCN